MPRSPLSACEEAVQQSLQIPSGACPEQASIPLQKILPPVLTLVATAAIIGYFIWRRMQRRALVLRERLDSTQERLLTTENVMQETQEQLTALRKVWEISWSDLSVADCIGQGANGQVFRGTWRGLPVAVKILTASYLSQDELRQEMDREATMLQTLRHAHVVQFHGAGLNLQNLPFLVTELMELGALTDLLLDPSGGLLGRLPVCVCVLVCVCVCVCVLVCVCVCVLVSMAGARTGMMRVCGCDCVVVM
jgi:hypothetical protein